jgi:hypothetical protein
MDNPAKICSAKLYDRETRIIFADLLNGEWSPAPSRETIGKSSIR